MDILKLPDKCPKCNQTIFSQKITIEGFGTKLYNMEKLSTKIRIPINVEENHDANNDLYNNIYCSNCGHLIKERGTNV